MGASDWMSQQSNNINLFHIVHVSRLPSIISRGKLLSDKLVKSQGITGTQIGNQIIKDKRATKQLSSYPKLCVGDCVPFYFCPRSIMLYVISKKNNPYLTYIGGQDEIIHLRLDMDSCIDWADQNGLKWVFTDSNAGNGYFNDYNQLCKLNQINWTAVHARQWQPQLIKDG